MVIVFLSLEIESSVQGITEIDEITSNSYPNVSIINLKLHDNIHIQESWDEVQKSLIRYRFRNT